jgi:LCP family protein required for cell wall assembly
MSEPGQLGRAFDPVAQGSPDSPYVPGGLDGLGDLMKEQERKARGTKTGSHSRSSTKKVGNTTPVANEAGLSALGQQMQQSDNGKGGRHRTKKKAKGRHRVRKVVLIGLVVLLVIVGGGAGYTYYVTHDLNRVEVKGLNGALTTGKEAGTENILMVGSTSRCALTVQNPAYGLCSQGVNGVNSDVIMILHADPAHHRLALLSLPRDLFIPNARSTGANKVDAGLFQGLTQLVAAIEEDFGIPIQHAVSLNFDQFANIVDALGGINMSFPISVFDAESGLNVQAATCVHLNGTQALEVVRARHLQYDSGTSSTYAEDWPQENLSDLARIRRDHEFLRVLGAAVAKQGLGNPLTDLNLINSVKSDLTFDQSWAVSDMANLVLDFHTVDINSVPQLTMPVAVVTDPDGAGGSLQYQGGTYGDVEFPSQPQDESAIDQVLGIGPGVDSMTGGALPASATVAVSVVNGTGAYNQAADTAQSLAALGFHIAGVGDAAPVGDVSETVVFYGSRSAAAEAAAERVAHSMTGSVIMAYDPSQVTDGAEVTVLTGTQFTVNAPPAPPAASTTAVPSGGTSSVPSTAVAPNTTSPNASAIAAPSPTTSGLEPWDPRACPAGAAPTAPVANPT